MLSPRETALFINAMVGDHVMKQEQQLDRALLRERETQHSAAHLDEETEIPHTAPTMVRGQSKLPYVPDLPVNEDTQETPRTAPPAAISSGPSPHIFTVFIALIVVALLVLGWFKLQYEQTTPDQETPPVQVTP